MRFLLILVVLLFAAPTRADLVLLNDIPFPGRVEIDGYGFLRAPDYTDFATALATLSSSTDDDGNPATPSTPDTLYVNNNSGTFHATSSTLTVGSSSLVITGPTNGVAPPRIEMTGAAATFDITGLNVTIQNLILEPTNASAGGIEISSVFGPAIRNIQFEFSGQTDAITLNNDGSNIVIDNCTFTSVRGKGSGSIGAPVAGTRWGNAQITNNVFDPKDLAPTTGSLIAFYIRGLQNGEFSHNRIEVYDDTTGENYAAVFRGSGTDETHSNEFHGNTFNLRGQTSGGSTVGLWLADPQQADGDEVRNSTITNNVFSATGPETYGILHYRPDAAVDSPKWSKGNLIAGNRFTGLTYGIYIWGWMRDTALSHNRFIGCTDAFVIDGLYYSAVTGNVIEYGDIGFRFPAHAANRPNNKGIVVSGNYLKQVTQAYNWQETGAPDTADTANAYVGNIYLNVDTPNGAFWSTWPFDAANSEYHVGRGDIRLDAMDLTGALNASRAISKED